MMEKGEVGGEYYPSPPKKILPNADFTDEGGGGRGRIMTSSAPIFDAKSIYYRRFYPIWREKKKKTKIKVSHR